MSEIVDASLEVGLLLGAGGYLVVGVLCGLVVLAMTRESRERYPWCWALGTVFLWLPGFLFFYVVLPALRRLLSLIKGG